MGRLELRRTGLLLGAVLGLFVAYSAQAIITIDKPADGTITSANNPDAQQIATALGITLAELGHLQYKYDGAESGLLAAYYDASISYVEGPKGENVVGATIDWIEGSPKYIAQPSYLVVKDGAEGSLLWFLYSIAPDDVTWDGKDTLVIRDVFNHGISGVDIWGFQAAVPEPTTMVAGALLLLPFGMSTLRVLRKRREA